ncbi:MAG: NADH-quinone oxidoreductase subunit J [Alphaproteobacteria bacterium]|jgi:NADH-quinone oxidoreductase subunit J|nr:NADH-quinone oxidoreductase subunit J [Alphaproteobacteria bacterium]MBT4017011.1 NADH-quinone oxidoreductase subunit J [Alphaproteobacteria bacterium]MBT4965388.1 NADH-quinone oxidoreductase subunit J [Alphaproteobacteria bacterium]MBT5160327.1 NADH-quinone oxidoreductase subunit J [Alphaproteobacteria bacterium]MBT6387160.1 NADH-quinone oxidoreductase subunit J [Alphaproteobacteria bacterium]
MIVHALAFYLFAAVVVASAVMVVMARNPVHSVLFLILAFFSAAGLFVLLGAEFLAMLLVVVYVGAVAVLFLFVVMMLDVNFAALREGVLDYLPYGLVVGLVMLVELGMLYGAWVTGPEVAMMATSPMPDIAQVSNTEALGQLLYTKYIYLFQAAGMILLVAMIGAIVLSNRQRDGVRRQVIANQVARTRKDAVEMKKVTPGGGI